MTAMSREPLIVYIPGLMPKPEAGRHREQLLRCLLAGIARLDPLVATQIGERDAFRLVSWNYDFYGRYRDISLDLADIQAVIDRDGASEQDVLAATSWKRRIAIWLLRMADFLPFMLPGVAGEETQVHLRDYFRYVTDRRGIGETAREKLKTVLRDAGQAQRPVLLLAHSMGSVIAYDALWQLSREEESEARVNLLLTSGSPLGQRIVQRHLLGAGETGGDRYPDNIGAWINIAATGELTAIDRTLRDDFAAMINLGIVRDIGDIEVFNYYHMQGSLNVHAEYGYLVNAVTARCVSDWWRATTAADSIRPGRDSA